MQDISNNKHSATAIFVYVSEEKLTLIKIHPFLGKVNSSGSLEKFTFYPQNLTEFLIYDHLFYIETNNNTIIDNRLLITSL